MKKEDQIWQSIESQFEGLQAAYDQLIEASDNLAAAMHFDKEEMLVKVLPTKGRDRRSFEYFEFWLYGKKDTIVRKILSDMEAAELIEKRKQLLKELKLTNEQAKVLGIEI